MKQMIWDARIHWYDIGLELRIPVSDLDSIRQVCRDDPGQALTEMLKKWVHLNRSRKKSYFTNALIDALKSKPIGYTQLAESLLQQYLSREG